MGRRRKYCANPLCKNELPIFKKKYCCPRCSDFARDIRAGLAKIKDDFKETRKGFIKFPNSMEFRNDCVGKYIYQTSIYKELIRIIK